LNSPAGLRFSEQRDRDITSNWASSKSGEGLFALVEAIGEFSLDGQVGHSTLLLQQALRFRSLLYQSSPVRIHCESDSSVTLALQRRR